jgi:hypothetical protein
MILNWLRLARATALPLTQIGARDLTRNGRRPDWMLGCAAFSVALGGCSLIDDFSQFRIVASDASDDDSGVGSAADAAVPLCGGEDCSQLTGPCTQGECKEGRCVATAIRDGRSCGADNCTVCRNGACDAPKDCTEFDGPCTKGVCNPSDGMCGTSNVNEGMGCFDNEPCTVSEKCSEGKCSGPQRDCSGFNDECSEGVCQKDTGMCTYGTPNTSRACNDFNPCTVNDRCDASGRCIPTGDASAGAACDDINACTGTLLNPDACDGSGNCVGGAFVLAGSACSDDNECTDPDACNARGVCTGAAVREGQACETACKTDNKCRQGVCLDAQGSQLGYRAQCYFNWCDSESVCQPRWQHDGNCDCGCDFVDPDCNDCSARMCEAKPTFRHKAAKWCDAMGKAINLCPESLKGDGKCDCGCQFEDPDCAGGSCCGPTGVAGCGDAFVEDCVCERQMGSDADPSCCGQQWTQRCANLAVQLGCMVCP